jgi:hypothetical protein
MLDNLKMLLISLQLVHSLIASNLFFTSSH